MNKFSNTVRSFDFDAPDGVWSAPRKSCFIHRVNFADAVVDESDPASMRQIDEETGQPRYAFECETREQATALCALLNVSEVLLEVAPQSLELARLGTQMRAAQNAFFKTRDRDALVLSVELEHRYDQAARELMNRVEGETS